MKEKGNEKDPLIEVLEESPRDITVSEEEKSPEGRLLSPEESDRLLSELLGEELSPSSESSQEVEEHSEVPLREERPTSPEENGEDNREKPALEEKRSRKRADDESENQSKDLDEELVSLRSLHEIALELASIREIEVLLERVLLSLMGRFLLKWDAIYIYRNGVFTKSASKGSVPQEIPEEFSSVHDLENLKRSRPELSFSYEELKTPSSKLVGLLLLGPRVIGDVWKEGELSFLKAVSGFVAISLDNALLIDQLQRKINQLSVLYKVSDIVNSSASLEELANLVMDALSSGFGLKEGAIYIKQGNSFWLFGSVGGRTFEGSYDSPEIAKTSLPDALVVPLQVGEEPWGFILATSIEETDGQVYSILASQISPVLKLLILERSYRRKLVDPVRYFLKQVEQTHARLVEVAVPYTLISVEIENLYTLSQEDADSAVEEVENLIESFESAMSYRVYPNRILALVPGEDADSVRETLYRELESLKSRLKEKGMELDFGVIVFSFPEDFSDPWEGIRLLDLNW